MINSNELFVTIEHNGQMGFKIHMSHATPRHKLPKIAGSRGWIEVDGSDRKSVTFMGGEHYRSLQQMLITQAGITLGKTGEHCNAILRLNSKNVVDRVEA